MIDDNTLYRKIGKRYVPCWNEIRMYADGIWLVSRQGGCKSQSCVLLAEDLPRVKAITYRVHVPALVDVIGKVVSNGWTHLDIANAVADYFDQVVENKRD